MAHFIDKKKKFKGLGLAWPAQTKIEGGPKPQGVSKMGEFTRLLLIGHFAN